MMFDNQKLINAELEEQTEIKMIDLIEWLRKNQLQEKEELFVMNGSVRPGIIVLINDTDWELLDTNNCMIQD